MARIKRPYWPKDATRQHALARCKKDRNDRIRAKAGLAAYGANVVRKCSQFAAYADVSPPDAAFAGEARESMHCGKLFRPFTGPVVLILYHKYDELLVSLRQSIGNGTFQT
jgi:hypothetical protein